MMFFLPKMGKYCSMALVLFFKTVFMATATADQCEVALMNRCFKAYREDLKATLTSESIAGHCFRVQV